jgi:hypothetical protein
MDGFDARAIKGVGPEPIAYWGSFQTNGTSNPASTTYRYPRGLAFTVTYSATGVYTITLPAGFTLPSQPHCVVVGRGFAALADHFDAAVLGETTLNAATRQIVIQAHRAGTGQAPANTAGNRIHFAILSSNSSGA